MAEKLGVGRCPICNADNARVSLSKSHYAVLTCSACSAQVFARGPRSDEFVRDLIIVERPAPIAPVEEVKIEPVPIPPVEAAKPAPAPKKKASGSFLEMFAGGEA